LTSIEKPKLTTNFDMPPKKIKLEPNQKKLTFFTRPGEEKVIDQTQEGETGPILIDEN